MRRTPRRVIGLVFIMVGIAACGGGTSGDSSAGTSVPGAVDPSVTTTMAVPEAPDPDLSDRGYVENLLEREEDGEWTRAEGLIATLGLFTGASEPGDVLRHGEVSEYEVTGVVAMARDYLESGTDEAAKAEIAALLDRIVFSDERLEAMAGIEASRPGLHAFAPFAAGAVQDCSLFFPNYESLEQAAGPCLEVRELHILDVPGEGPYRVFVPDPELGTGGWTEEHYDLALEAMIEAIPVYSALEGEATDPVYGEGSVGGFAMPPVNIVFSLSPEGFASADSKVGQTCGIMLFTKLQEPFFTPAHFKQVIAHELGHCFQTDRFTGQNSVAYEYRRWRDEGVSELLSNLVYPDNDLEWRDTNIARLNDHELDTTLFDRAYENALFFQYVHSEGGIESVFALIEQLPTEDGHQAQKDAMAAIPGIFDVYQEFVRTVTDESVVDAGEHNVPYPMTETNHPTVEITAPGTVVLEHIEPFGVVRRHLVVESGRQACLTWQDADLFVDHRPHPQGEWTPLTSLLPVGLEESGSVALVVTAKSERDVAIVVSSVHDLNEETDGEVVGTWVVDNASLQESIDYLAPVQEVTGISGRIVVTFRHDGTVLLVYDGFTVTGFSDVALEDGSFSSDFSRDYTSVTNAEGVDTYEVAQTGEFIFYGTLSEGDFLEGTETVTELTSGYFFRIETDQSELEIQEPETQVHERQATGWGILGAGTKVKFACGGQFLMIDDVILSRVDS